jgi:pimeloyl-ACP methyl ester carboxylesterase
MVLLEGMGGDIPGWRRNIPTLARELSVIAYDLRGNGLSDEPPGPCTMTTFVEDTVSLLDELEVEKAHVYGQSFGGMIAQEMAITRPERVTTLVLGCTHPGSAHALLVEGSKVPKGEPWRALYAPGFPEAHPEHVADDLRSGASQPRHPAGARRQWEAMQGWSAFDRLGLIQAPTLVIHGSEDLVVAPGNAEILASHVEGAELHILEGAGHVYHSEQPEAADAVVLDFVRRRGSG